MGTLSPDRMKCCAVLIFSTLLAVPSVRGQDDKQDKAVVLQENYDNFFHFVDSFLWDSEDSEGRMYRRGYMRMMRPRILTVYNSYGQQEPSSLYRSFVDSCYGFLCWSGLNSLADSVARMG